MRATHNRAFKEWAVVCRALREGAQTVLLRKGGIREEDGVFQIEDSEFFLMPTYEHQNAALLQHPWQPDSGFDPKLVTIDTYAVVDTMVTCDDEERLNTLASEYIWNEAYVRLRLDFNPYDPLYVLILRAYRLAEPIRLPVLPEYGGCRSWVTLDRSLSTVGATPALTDAVFETRKENVLRLLDSGATA